MNSIKTSQETDSGRRRFLGAAAMTVASACLCMAGSVDLQASMAAANFAPHTSFGSLKTIDAGLPKVG